MMNEMGHIGVDIIQNDILNMDNVKFKMELNNKYERIRGKIEMLFSLDLISEMVQDQLSYNLLITYQSNLYKIKEKDND